MDFIPEYIQAYAESHSLQEPEVLQALNRETHQKVLKPRMLSGHFQGRLLYFFAKMIAAKNILEIGTYTGYATISLAEALPENGQITTIDYNEEIKPLALKYFEKSGFLERINFVIGDAKKIIPNLNETFDLVFIDADKNGYQQYYDLVLPKVRTGGLIIADNVLWSGKVANGSLDNKTETIKDFNRNVNSDSRVENILLPVRDGLMLLRKK